MRSRVLALLTPFVLLALTASLFPLGAQTHLVIVGGLGGEKKYTEAFAQDLAGARRRGGQALQYSRRRGTVVRRG